MPERVIAVVGPTAAGKSELSLGLALALGGEVVNADSMQLYAGMDIGTAKLSPAQRRGVPHHLLDIWDVREAASVATYQRLAREAIAGIRARGRVPVLAGGSGLYLRAARSRPCCPSTSRGTRWSSSGSGWTEVSWTGGSRSGPRGCGGKAWWTR